MPDPLTRATRALDDDAAARTRSLLRLLTTGRTHPAILVAELDPGLLSATMRWRRGDEVRAVTVTVRKAAPEWTVTGVHVDAFPAPPPR